MSDTTYITKADTFIVSKLTGFKYGGQPFKVGDIFPWQRMAVPWRKILVLVSSDFILEENEFYKKHKSFTPTKTKRVRKSTPPAKKKLDAGNIKQLEKSYSLHHRGGGYYDVIDEIGTAVNGKALRKTQAKIMIDSLKV